MKENIYHGAPVRSSQNESLMLLGSRLASGVEKDQNLSPKDLAAVIAEYHIKPPIVPQLGQAAGKDVKLLAPPIASIHH